LVTDFWAAYNAVVCAQKQKCLPHLLRDLKRTQHYHKPDGDWPAFSKQLRRLIRDAIRLSKRRRELPAERFASRRGRLEGVESRPCQGLCSFLGLFPGRTLLSPHLRKHLGL
jgi:transposase